MFSHLFRICVGHSVNHPNPFRTVWGIFGDPRDVMRARGRGDHCTFDAQPLKKQNHVVCFASGAPARRLANLA